MAKPAIVGRIECPATVGTASRSATLGADMTWTSDAPGLAEYLNRVHSPARYTPAAGWPGHAAIDDAARDLGGRVVERSPLPDAPDDPDELY